MAADLVRLLGDPWVDDLNLDRMERLPAEYVSDNLRTRCIDLPWWAPFKPGTGHPAGAEDASELARVGALIIDCDSGPDFLARAQQSSTASR